ncbi:hypothetical protein ACROYT_G025666 [Oculina patagonica]
MMMRRILMMIDNDDDDNDEDDNDEDNNLAGDKTAADDDIDNDVLAEGLLAFESKPKPNHWKGTYLPLLGNVHPIPITSVTGGRYPRGEYPRIPLKITLAS